MIKQDKVAAQMFAALNVVAKDKNIRAFLAANDPMALRQVELAIEAVTGNPRCQKCRILGRTCELCADEARYFDHLEAQYGSR